MASIRSGIGEFQSTLPREERLFHNCIEHVFNYFNPRSHERSDGQSGHVYQKNHQISIHAPTRGATYRYGGCGTPSLFQSTLPREERLFPGLYQFSLREFQSTLPREERRITHNCVIFCFIFQSTLPREERLKHSL